MSFKRFYLKGMAVCTLICTLFAVPAFAANADIAKIPNIRYLGGYIASGSSLGIPSNMLKMLESVDCDKHNEQNGYYNSLQEKMDCLPDPFCSGKWHCHTNCLKAGFVDGVADSKKDLDKQEPDYSCDSCQMKGKTYWRCEPNGCEDNLVEESRCEKWKKFVPNVTTHRFGKEMCGTCVENTTPCIGENITKGLKTFAEVKKMIDGDDSQCYTCENAYSAPGKDGDIKCYKCSTIKGYKRGPWMDSNSCYTYYNISGFNTSDDTSGNSSNCYKRLLHVCEVDKYLTGKKAEGGNVSIEIDMTDGSGEALDISSHDDTFLVDQANQFGTLIGCECKDYIYDLKVTPEKAVLKAGGGTVVFTITSTRTGPTSNSWEYDFTPLNKLCSVVKKGAQLQVSCPRRVADSPATFGVTFKQVTKGGETKLYRHDELITILADKCPEGQSMIKECSGGLVSLNGDLSDAGQQCFKCVEDVCPEGKFSCNAGEVATPNGKKSPSGRACYNCAADVCPEGKFSCGSDEAAIPNGKKSPSGKTCYNCVSDKCPSGYTRGTPPSTEGYDVITTATGQTCFMKIEVVLPDSCPSGYDTTTKKCDPGYVEEKQGQTNGKDCTRCTPVSCPSPSGCKDFPYCPETKADCTGKVKCGSTTIAGVTKYYDCKCDVKSCNDANKRYDNTTCSCIDKDCSEGYSKDVKNCKDGEQLTADPSNSNCKRCQAKACEAGLLPTKVNPAGGDATGNQYVTCSEIKCEGTTKYKNCTCKISDQICGTGKKADTNSCTCKDCGGIVELSSAGIGYICYDSLVTCGGQKRCLHYGAIGSQWTRNHSECACTETIKADLAGYPYCDKTDKSCVPAKGCTATNSNWLPEAQALAACKNGAYTCTKVGTAENKEVCYTITPRDCKGDGYTLSKQPSSGSDTYETCLTGSGKMYKCKDGYKLDSGTNKCVSTVSAKGCQEISSSFWKEATARRKCNTNSGFDCSGPAMTAPNGEVCYTLVPTKKCANEGYTLDTQPSPTGTYSWCKYGDGYKYKCNDGYNFNGRTKECVSNSPARPDNKKSCKDINPNWFTEAEKSGKKCGSGYDCTCSGRDDNGAVCCSRTVHNCGSSYNLDLRPSSGSDTYDTCLTGDGAMYKCKTNYVFSEDAGNKCIGTCPSDYEESAASCTKLNRLVSGPKVINGRNCYKCGDCKADYTEINGGRVCKQLTVVDWKDACYESKDKCNTDYKANCRDCVGCKGTNQCRPCETRSLIDNRSSVDSKGDHLQVQDMYTYCFKYRNDIER